MCSWPLNHYLIILSFLTCVEHVGGERMVELDCLVALAWLLGGCLVRVLRPFVWAFVVLFTRPALLFVVALACLRFLLLPSLWPLLFFTY